MSIQTNIIDGSGKAYKAKVSSIGEIVTGPFTYDDASFKLLDVADTAYNFYKPVVGKQFIIKGIFLKANKLVSNVTDATIIVYEATSDSSTTVSKVLFQTSMTSGDIVSANPVNIIVTEGLYLNGKTDDDDVAMNIIGHYIPRLS